MLIDSHCHLPTKTEDIQKILDRAKSAEVEEVINVGTSISESKDAIATAQNFDNVYATVGVYPHAEQDKSLENILTELENLLTTSDKIVAIGECGIDIVKGREGRPIAQQIKLFEKQIQLTLKHDLPIVIHNRNGDEQVLELLKKYHTHGLTGVAHCFDSTWETAQRFLDYNFYISFSGFITYSNKKYLHETATKTPHNKILIETDSPYIIPKGVENTKSKRNEPKNVKIIARTLADIKQISAEEVNKFTYNNTCSLFKI